MGTIRHLALEYRLRKLEKVVSGSMPKYFYHGTSSASAQYILKHGLKPSKEINSRVHGLTNTNKVYLTSTVNSALRWAQMADSDNYAVLKINSSYLKPDLLEGDYNALIDPFEDSEPDEKDFDRFANLRFDGDDLPVDYEYASSIPPEAISIIYQSDKELFSDFTDRSKNGDYKWFVSNWDKLLDTECGLNSYQELLCGAVTQASGIPINYGANKKLRDIVLSLPVKILNYEWKDKYGSSHTVLKETACFGGSCDAVGLLMSDIANKFENTISDTNIKLLWEFFTRQQQLKNVDVIINLPKRFLEIGKPYITQKIAKKLDL